MPRFRKRPVVIEAHQLMGNQNGQDLADWCGGRFLSMSKPSDPTDVSFELRIPTLEGVMTASQGDWIIRGVKGEFYSCKPDIFDATFEQVE